MSKRNNFFSSFSAYTPRTIAFLTFIGIPNDGTVFYAATAFQITGAQIWTAINNFDLGIISDGLDLIIQFCYLYIGGTAARHAVNFMNPATFLITWAGGITHNGAGVTGNGINGWGNTGYVPATHDILNNSGWTMYCRTNEVGTYVDIGSQTNAFTNRLVNIRNRGGFLEYADVNNAATGTASILADVRKTYSVNRTGSTTLTVSRDGAVIDNLTDASTGLSPESIGLMAYNAGSSGQGLYSPRNYAAKIKHRGLNATQAGNLRTRLDALQTSLFRNV